MLGPGALSINMLHSRIQWRSDCLWFNYRFFTFPELPESILLTPGCHGAQVELLLLNKV